MAQCALCNEYIDMVNSYLSPLEDGTRVCEDCYYELLDELEEEEGSK